MGPAALTAGAGLLTGSKGNKAAQRQANSANAQAAQLTARQMQLFDTLFGMAKNGAAALDPNTQIKQLLTDRATYDPIIKAGQAGADRTAGYMPTDSEARQHQNIIDQRSQTSFMQQANAIRRNAPAEQIGLFGPLAGGSILNPALQNAQFNQQMAYGRMQSPGSFLQAAMPFFGQRGSGFRLPNTDMGMPGSTYRSDGSYSAP